MSRNSRPTFTGPSLFSYGFRPFFLAAGLFGAAIIPLWMLLFEGRVSFTPAFPATDWHIHEMVFGYTAAVIAGFLFTAIPNWTGRMPTRGWPLAGLAFLWLAGRIAMSGVIKLQGLTLALIDSAFLLAVVIMIAVEIIAGRNWRNLIVVVPVSLLLLANGYFHYEIISEGVSNTSRRLSFAIVIFLIMLIGGRIIPSFTRNWLAKQKAPALPIPFNRFDSLCMLSGAGGMGLWVTLPDTNLSSAALLLAAALHLIRLSRWQGVLVLRSPLLLMLHIAYLFIPMGLAATALLDPSTGFHLLGIGVIASMTMAVMTRATLGHTARDLKAGPLLSTLFILLILAAVIRGFFANAALFGLSGLWLAAILWTLAYTGFALLVGPMLLQAKKGKKAVSIRPKTPD